MKLKQNSFLLLVTILLFFIMYAIGCVLFNAQGFSKTQNFLNLFISNAGLIVIGIGMTIVMITGGIDISVGSLRGDGLYDAGMDDGKRRDRCGSSGSHRAGHRNYLWSGTGIPGCLYGYPAIYRNTCRYVLCQRYDCHHFQRYDQYYQ